MTPVTPASAGTVAFLSPTSRGRPRFWSVSAASTGLCSCVTVIVSPTQYPVPAHGCPHHVSLAAPDIERQHTRPLPSYISAMSCAVPCEAIRRGTPPRTAGNRWHAWPDAPAGWISSGSLTLDRSEVGSGLLSIDDITLSQDEGQGERARSRRSTRLAAADADRAHAHCRSFCAGASHGMRRFAAHPGTTLMP
jgi:hypothetical protein